MEGISVVKVRNRQQMSDFIRIADVVYRNCEQYVPDLERDIRANFNQKKNAGMDFSDLQPFVAYRGKEVVGRIVGIVNRKANKRWNTSKVRFSLIEFIDDTAVSEALIKAVEDWGREKGMTEIIGPMGITDFDKEGMLIDDFDLPGSLTAIYNPPYYPQHLERLGFQKEVDWVQIRVQVPKEVPAKYARVSDYAHEMLGLRVEKLTDKQVAHDGYGQQIFHLLNQAYAGLYGFSEFSHDQIDDFVKHYLKLLDNRLMPVVFNDKNEMVGAAVTMGSLAEAMHKAHGRLLPFGWFHLLKALKWKPADHAEMLLIAVRPDYQGLGVNALFFSDLIPIYNQLGFKWAETGPQLEDNVRELSQWKPLHPQTVKRRRCYKKSI